MKHRTRAYETIVRSEGNIDVPITAECRRKYHLMQTDCVTLSFVSGVPLRFSIGDYMDDELFGRFYVQKEQMPSYDKSTGAYKHELEMVAPYMMWSNRVFMLTSILSGSRVRKETEWTLTAALATHVQEVAYNVNLLGLYYGNVGIDIKAEKAAEVRCVTYSGKDIISALNMMADEWECEWWVTEESGNATIHFGKCEAANEPLVFAIGDNVETISVQDNRNTYANKIWAYGGATNVPSTYRKTLTFKVTSSIGMERYMDNAHPITQAMLLDSGINIETNSLTLGNEKSSTAESQYFHSGSTSFGDEITASSNVDVVITPATGYRNKFTDRENIELTAELDLVGVNNVIHLTNVSRIVDGSMMQRGVSLDLPLDNVVITLPHGLYYLRLVVRVFGKLGTTREAVTSEMWEAAANGALTTIGTAVSKMATLVYEGKEYVVRFNPDMQEAGGESYSQFVFEGNKPSGFNIGSEYTLKGLDYTNVPLSWWSDPYDDPSTLQKIGSRRLRMPTQDYVAKDNLTDEGTVEETIIFDKVYPRAVLIVTDVTTEAKKSVEEREDGSKVTWAWTQFTLSALTASGNDFPFRTKYITDGNKLKCRFLTPEDVVEAGYDKPEASCRLAGMSFEVSYDNTKQTYKLIRNEDYGAMLPNDLLRPDIGDPFILENWNPLCMEELGLTATAEEELQTKATAYLNAIEEGQFTLTCDMMSDYGFLAEDFRLHESVGNPIDDSEGANMYVQSDNATYSLPTAGAKVKVNHASLPSGSKTSRILGYEMKLDMPFDTPRYTIGETDAYSRLKQLEKEITKLS